MGFTARLYIQGLGINRLSDDGSTLEVFFPTIAAAADFQLLTPQAVPVNASVGDPPPPICEHFAFLQFSARNLDSANEDVWLTAMLDREMVDVEVTGAGVKPLDVGAQGRVEDMISMQAVLAGIVTDVRQLRTDLTARKKDFLHAHVRLSRGTAKGYEPRLFDVGRVVDVRSSGTIQVELGDVDTLALRIQSFDPQNPTTRTLTFHPRSPTNDCDVWIRNFCSFARPDPSAPIVLERGDTDPDFVLNYALLEGVRSLTVREKAQLLPIPVIFRGGQIGGNHGICLGAAV